MSLSPRLLGALLGTEVRVAALETADDRGQAGGVDAADRIFDEFLDLSARRRRGNAPLLWRGAVPSGKPPEEGTEDQARQPEDDEEKNQPEKEGQQADQAQTWTSDITG